MILQHKNKIYYVKYHKIIEKCNNHQVHKYFFKLYCFIFSNNHGDSTSNLNGQETCESNEKCVSESLDSDDDNDTNLNENEKLSEI